MHYRVWKGWTVRGWRVLMWAAVVGGLYAIGAYLTVHYLAAPDAGASFFPPAGLTVAALLLSPRRTWPVFLLAIGIAEFSLDMWSYHLPTSMVIGFTAANTIEPLVGASLTIWAARWWRQTPRGVVLQYFLFAVVAGPFVGGVIGGYTGTVYGHGSFLQNTGEWWLGDALGVLVVATPIIAWKRRHFYDTPGSLGELIVIAMVALAISVIPAVFIHETLAYAALPVLMFAAIRGGPFGVGLAGLGVGFGASWVVASGHARALITARGAEGGLVDTQIFIAVTILSALVLAIEVAERTRAQQILRSYEAGQARAELAAIETAVSERRRIARETHDIVGHALNVMILSGAAARRVLDHDPQQARELLSTVEDVGRDAFRDLDVALGLTDQSADFAAPKGLADIDELVARLVQAGMQVDYRIEGSPRPLPRLVDGSAYRIVQEALTNVAQHAVDAHTIVHVRFEPLTLFLEVSDHTGGVTRRNGKGKGNGNGKTNGNGNANGGRGLIGMRERVAVLGGQLVAGPIPDGFSVVAELPLEAV
jgi:signal transduction histidine kinase